MIFNVVLPGVVLANVGYKWLTAAGFGSELTSGVTDTGEFYAFLIDAVPPAGALEIFVYDVNDHSNFSRGNYAQLSISPNDIADAVLARNIAGGSSAGRIVSEALAFLRNKWSVVGNTLTVYDTDDTTVLWTATIASDASAAPVTGSDPI